MSHSPKPVHAGPPPDPPELPEGVDPGPAWPWWYAPVGLVAAFGVLIVVGGAIGVIVGLAGLAGPRLDKPPPAVNIAIVLLQDAVFVATAVVLAAQTLRPRLWHFGLRRTRLWPAVGWSALALVGFFLLEVVYNAAFKPKAEQSVLESLGANDGAVGLVVGGIVVIIFAPIAEEFFFRGFFYKALRTRLGVPSAAVIDGLLFGAIHIEPENLVDTLIIAPLLAIFGVVLCLLYERTGTLFSVIALHACNNTLAYAVGVEAGPAVPLAIGAAMLAGCALAPRFIRPGTRRGGAVPLPTGSAA